jgi:hypothetical protein
VDFEATDSQREFYAEVLRRVRAQLPRGMDLTMTALVSWCSEANGWMKGLPWWGAELDGQLLDLLQLPGRP